MLSDDAVLRQRPFSSLSQEEIPIKLRCAICPKLAVNAFRLPCCETAICESCKFLSAVARYCLIIDQTVFQVKQVCRAHVPSANIRHCPPRTASRIRRYAQPFASFCARRRRSGKAAGQRKSRRQLLRHRSTTPPLLSHQPQRQNR
jgi:hypothetical protein